MANAGNQIIIHLAQEGQWRRFRNPMEIFAAADPKEVVPILNHIEKEVEAKKIYAVGFIAYEAGQAFEPALRFRSAGGFPLLWFGLFKKAEPFIVPAVKGPLLQEPVWQSSVTEQEYKKAIRSIKAYLARGATYQVNYSFRLSAACKQNAANLFLRLVAGRNIPYAAFIEAEQFALCSLSPELFFSLDGDRIISRPMKGTMPRGFLQSGDRMIAQELYESEKNRAENVMILDMVRNDLGRIAAAGTVRVVSMFAVEKHDTVWQMTSAVQARTDASLPRIFQALFPPASVTGAPKVNTMRIIAELENTPRRIYTGSIGYLAPGRRAQFNVAIRTLLVDKTQGRAEYGVGGGIVWDSVDDAEYRECILKAKILRPQPEFSLLETMLWTPGEGYFLLDLHMERLMASAAYFSFPCNEKKIRLKLAARAAGFTGAQRVRLLLARNGRITLAAEACASRGDDPPAVCLAKHSVARDNPFLYHKTTNRIIYEQARAARPDYAEVLLWNERGEVTEFCAANVVVNFGGKMLTPPVVCGLLPGTYRAWLLAHGRVREQIIKTDDLPRAAEIYFCNSVRKMQKVKLETGN